MANNKNDHTICGDAKVLLPPQFRDEFGKRQNVKAPLLLCDIDIFKRTLCEMTAALPDANLQYAMKTNDAAALLATVMQDGHGFDCSSVGEIRLVSEVAEVLGLGVNAIMANCSYGNPNKTTSDIKAAYDLGVRRFSLDCTAEIDKIAAVAPRARVYIRTFVDATQKTAISAFTNKFGAPASTIPQLATYAQQKGLTPYAVGLSVGGGQTDPNAFALGIQIAADINKQCAAAGVATMTGITFCGGLPAPSAPGAPTFASIGKHIQDACLQHGIQPNDVTLEPGRSVATTCGIIEAKVITLKPPMEEGEPWTLVLNVGPFKGLFEMERTNLTYKMAAYDTPSQMVPCRIVDDTCDSKGVCFKEHKVRMPSTLQEGSRVYFLDTGSYTSAYAMENFNRTLPLVAQCFPDPLANARALPDWLQGVQLPGQAAHPDKDFKALCTAYSKLTTDPERTSFLIQNVPGAGALGTSLLNSAHVRRFRQLIAAILEHNPDTPGEGLQIGFLPQHLFKEIWQGWVANSAFLTPNAWLNYSHKQAKAGATAYLCLQNQYRTNVKHCTLMHATLVIVPNDKADGPPRFVEVNYNPYTIDGLDQKVLDQAFSSALRNEQFYRDPLGPIEQLIIGTKLDPKLANADLLWAGPLHDREPLALYWPKASAKDGKLRPIDLEGALMYELDEKQHSSLSQMLAALEASYAAGYSVSNRAHVDHNSCLRTTIRILTVAMLGKDNHFGDDWTTDQTIEHMAKLAHRRWWTDKPGHSIRNIEAYKEEGDDISAEDFIRNIRSILCHPTMMRPFGGENAYDTTYMTSIPHNNYHAQKLYRAAALLTLDILEETAKNLCAI